MNKDGLGAKKIYLNRKGNSCYAKIFFKYLNNFGLGSDTVRHESVQNISCCTDSRIDYSKKIKQLQGNTIQIPIDLH